MPKKRLNYLSHKMVLYLQKYPVRFPAIGFLALISVGFILLSMPFVTTNEPLTWTEALFTSVSASCITGLSVIDIGTKLSFSGQILLLLLIECGALGIMSFSIGLMNLFGARTSFLQQRLIRDTFGHETNNTNKQTVKILQKVFLYTITIQIIGAIFLFPTFYEAGMSGSKAIYFAIFHSISGFCNAGFCLFPNSLMQFQGHYFMNFLMIFLIVCGGLGFITISQLKDFITETASNFINKGFVRKKARIKKMRFSFQNKIIFITTISLMLIGFIFIAALEWNHDLSTYSTTDKLIRALFQSVTTRSSGFNTIDIGSLGNSTLFLMIVFMFIGASPGSCGGGIKVTTFAVLVNMGVSRFLGKTHPQQFKKSISNKNMQQAVRVVIIFLTLATVFVFTMLAIEPNILFRDIIFETISALTTCGLSTGITADLTSISRIIICFAMYFGRLGPLAIATAFSMNEKESFSYSEEEIMIG